MAAITKLDMFNRVQVERLESGQPAFDPTGDQMRALLAALPHTQVAARAE